MKFPSSWGNTEMEVADAYSDTLSSLKINSKPIINTLTELANGYSKDTSHIIVYLVEERIKEVPDELKLTVLYLLDSIVKNHSNPYKNLFVPNLVSTFTHVFRHSAEKGRAALFKLRGTWCDVFPATVLLDLDHSVNKLDPAWPICKPKNPVLAPTNIHINPAVFGRNAQPERESDRDRIRAELEKKEVELMELKRKQLEMEVEQMKKAIQEAKEKVQATPIVAEPPVQENKSKILVNTKKVRDPRVRNQLPKQITDMLDKEKASTPSVVISSSEISKVTAPSKEKSRSKSPERPSTERRQRSPDTKKAKTSTPPSPGQPESPTSTVNIVEEKVEKKAPPPPTIRDEIKKSPTKVSSSSKKSSSSSSSDRHRHSSSSSGSKSRKREHEHSKSKSSRSNRDESDKSPARKRDKEETPVNTTPSVSSSPSVPVTTPVSTTKPAETIPSRESSSPSPPPVVAPIVQEAAPVHTVPPVKPSRRHESKKYKIPKKNKSRSPSPSSFKEEGPHVEFNSGRPLHTKRKGKSEIDKIVDKKAKMTTDLFGDEATEMMGSKNYPTRSLGWAKIKEVNPDEYRTPIKPSSQFEEMNLQQRPDGPREDFRRGHSGPRPHWQNQNERPQLRNDPRQPRGMQPMNNFGGGFANRLHFGPGTGKFPTPFEGYGPQHPMNDGLGHFLDRFGSTNPKVVISDVIPTIIRQAQENLASGVLDPNQFSKVMRQVMQLKEQAMMLQADKMHREQSRPRSVGPIPQWNVPNVPRAMNPLHPQQMNAPLKPPVDGMPQKLPVMPPPPPPVPLFAHSVGKRPVSPEVPVVSRDLPLASIDDLEKINADPVSNIEIDKMPRDIRFYGEMATIILGPADVRRISFKVLAHDFSRNVIIDDQIRIKLPIDVQEYVVFPLNGMEHRIKLGAPTRELWVDGKWYQCFFNETTRVRFGANFHKVFLEGPPPNVEIGKVTLNHICAGTVQVIVDGNINDPKTIYLDPKPQRIDIGGKPHIFRFVEGLKTLLINGHPFMAHFGGTPMLIYVNQVKHYIRLTSLPEGVRPGHIHIEGLDPPRAPTSPNQNRPTTCPPSPPTVSTENSQDGMDSSFENKAFDRILSMLPSPSTPRQNKESRRLTSQYSSSPSFEGALKNSGPVTQEMSLPAAPVVKPARVAPEPSVDIHNLWSQLLGAGLIGGPSSAAIPGLEVSASANNASTPKIKKEKVEAVKAIEKAKPVQKPVEPVDLVKPVVLRSHDRTLKSRQLGLIQMLYNPSALQCKNCGLRYSPTDMIEYSQHLDWHFRMKRREKENARKAQSRNWYFEREDWINSDEIADGEKDFAEENETVKEDDKDEIPIVPVGPNKENKTCPICREDFEEFYTEDNNPEKDDGGQWYYRNAVESDSRNFHPQCLQDKTLNEGLEISNMSEEENNSKSNLELSTDMSMEVDSATTDVKVKTEPEDIEIKKEDVPEPTAPAPTITTAETSTTAETAEASTTATTDAEPSTSATTAEAVTSPTETTGTVSSTAPITVKQGPGGAEPEPQLTVPVSTPVEEAKLMEDSTSSSQQVIPSTEIKTEPQEASDIGTSVEADKANAEAIPEVETAPKVEPTPETDVQAADGDNKENDSSNLEKSLDGSGVTDTAPNFVAPNKLTAAAIRINLTSAIEQGKTLERRESVVSNSSDVDSSTVAASDENSEMDVEGVVQPPKFADAETKPKLVDRKFVVMPPQMKGVDTSGLCSIM